MARAAKAIQWWPYDYPRLTFFALGAILALVVFVCSGCAGSARLGGPNGVHVSGALAASFYEGAAGTRAGATWGNMELAGETTHDAEWVSLDRRGLSDNLRAVLGDDLGHELARSLCAIPAVAPSCISSAISARVFDGEE